MNRILERWRLALAAAAGAVTALLPGCGSPPPLPAEHSASASATPGAGVPEAGSSADTIVAARSSGGSARASGAATARAYRQDAASHIYGLNQERIYKGRLPPMLYAIGTLQVDLDGQGRVRSLNWMRRPSHAP